MGRRVIGISGSLIWSKTIMELIFNPCGEFRWSPEGPVSRIHSPHLQDGAPGIFSDLLRSVQMLKGEWGAESKGSYRIYSSLVKLQHWFLGLRWKICLQQKYSLGFCACSEGPAFGRILLMMMMCEHRQSSKTREAESTNRWKKYEVCGRCSWRR